MNRSRSRLALTTAVLVAALSGCKADEGPDLEDRVLKVDAVSATTATGAAGTVASPSPIVRVTDSKGNAAANVEVVFTVTTGNGKVEPAVVMTGPDGRASTVWTLGQTVSDNTVTARVGALEPLVFTAKSVPGGPATVEPVSLAIPILSVGSVSPTPVQVIVRDGFKNPIPGVLVSFSVISGGGSIVPSNAITDANGLAPGGTWTMGPIDGVQSIRAQTPGAGVVISADTYDCAGAAPCTGLGELVFRRDDDQLHRINVNGTGLTKLTSDGVNFSPAWSADGSRIAFVRYTPSGNNLPSSDVWIMNADGSNQVRRTSKGIYQSVAWSPDGRQLAIAGYPSGSDLSEISIISAENDGSAEFRLVTDGASPVWSPDGRKILYAHGTGYYDYSRIYLINSDGTSTRPIFNEPGTYSYNPAWSPDGQRIAFVRCQAGCAGFTLNVDGSALTPVVSGGSLDRVSWSPNGKWLVSSYYTSGITYLPIGGGAARLVVTNGFSASWRPVAR